MSLSVASLNSGSNGNCYYIGNCSDAVLVDAGISCKEVEKRMTRLGLPLSKVRAIFISHEHNDHTSGVTVMANKLNVPIYISHSTYTKSGLQLQEGQRQYYEAFKPIILGDLVITAFPKFHDAIDPHSFTISCLGVNVGVYTDIGSICENVIKQFSQCHAAFLETNYDEKMLESGNYPRFLKNRISGAMGHLSNNQALELFRLHRSPLLSHLFLSHLSKNNNCPDLVSDLFSKHSKGVKIIVASRHSETPLYVLSSPQNPGSVRILKIPPKQLAFPFSRI